MNAIVTIHARKDSGDSVTTASSNDRHAISIRAITISVALNKRKTSL